MSVMLGDMAVTAVVNYVNDRCIMSSSRHSVTGKCLPLVAYKYEKPSNIVGEYIAVNHLPFVHRSVVEEGIVNINIHVPKLKSGLPDTKRLSQLAQRIVEMFPEGTYLEKAFYEFLSDSRPTSDNDDTYYINIQLNVIFNNLNS